MQNNEGGEKVRNEFQSQVKKLLDEGASIPSKPVEVNEAQLPDEAPVNSSLPISEETSTPIINTIVEDVPMVTVDSNVSSTVNSEEAVNECAKETTLPITIHEGTSQIADIANIIPAEIVAKKVIDEDSSKPG